MNARVPYIFSKKEQKAFNKELNRQLAQAVDNLAVQMEYIIFRQIRKKWGKGAKSLRELYDSIYPEMVRLREYYEMGAHDESFLCKHELDSIGINISEWHKQNPALIVDFNRAEE